MAIINGPSNGIVPVTSLSLPLKPLKYPLYIMHHFISFLLRAAYAAGFGYMLFFHPEDIVQYIPQLLGGVLLFETVAQFLELFMLKLKTEVNKWFFLVPGIVLLYSLFLILFCTSEFNGDTTMREAFSPSNGTSWTTTELRIGGLCFIAFLLSELCISIRFMKPLFRAEKFAEEQRIRKEAERQRKLDEEKEKKNAEVRTSESTPRAQPVNEEKA